MLVEIPRFAPPLAVRPPRIVPHASVFAVALLLLGACVTINVYFPAAAAEQAADRFIDGVWGQEGAAGAEQAPEAGPGAQDAPAPDAQSRGPTPTGDVLASTLGRAIDWFAPPAGAQQADVDISTPAASALQKKMRARHKQLAPHYASGAVGLTADGLVAVRDAKAVPLKQRRAVTGLVAAENADRDALYREVARANGHPEWREQIQATFARRWIDRAERGWYYRSSNGWSQR